MTGSQFSLLATLVLFVRKGIITEEEMFEYYKEIDETYKQVYKINKSHDEIIRELLDK